MTLNATRFYSQSFAGPDVEQSGFYNQQIRGESGVIVTPFSRQTIRPDYPDTEFISPDYGYASSPIESDRDRHDIPTSGIPVDYNGPHLGEAVSPWDDAVSEVVTVVVIVVL